MNRKELDGDFDTSLQQVTRLTCETCAHSWKSDKEPTQIKRGMIVVEDICPSCGEYISKCV